jgi:hypothetical protein
VLKDAERTWTMSRRKCCGCNICSDIPTPYEWKLTISNSGVVGLDGTYYLSFQGCPGPGSETCNYLYTMPGGAGYIEVYLANGPAFAGAEELAVWMPHGVTIVGGYPFSGNVIAGFPFVVPPTTCASGWTCTVIQNSWCYGGNTSNVTFTLMPP